MAEHAKRAGAVAEVARRQVRRAAFQEVGAQRLVHALARVGRLLEEAAALRYVFRCAYNHIYTMSYTPHGCQEAAAPPSLVGWQTAWILDLPRVLLASLGNAAGMNTAQTGS